MEINKKIREKRKNMKIRQKDLASFLNVSQKTYADYESGRIRLSVDNFLLICDFFKTNPLEFLKTEDDHYFILSSKDLKELNDVVKKINDQICENESAKK